MKLKTKLSICMYLLPKDVYLLYTTQFSILNIHGWTPLSSACARKAKENPFFIWDDLKKLQIAYNEFDSQVMQCKEQGKNKLVNRILQSSPLYSSLVKEVVKVLEVEVVELCKSKKVLHPRDFYMYSKLPIDELDQQAPKNLTGPAELLPSPAGPELLPSPSGPPEPSLLPTGSTELPSSSSCTAKWTTSSAELVQSPLPPAEQVTACWDPGGFQSRAEVPIIIARASWDPGGFQSEVEELDPNNK